MAAHQQPGRPASVRSCLRAMPKATKPSRQIAHFEDGELWCTADATPPVSPGGWYFRLRDTPVGWIGPFPTAEAATAAPQGANPLAAARRRLDEWARATAESGAEPPVEAVPVGTTVDRTAGGRRGPVHSAAARSSPSNSRQRTDASRNVGANGEHDGNQAWGVRPADRSGPDKPAPLDPPGVAAAERECRLAMR